jgi:uncharacterized membrane protein YadS
MYVTNAAMISAVRVTTAASGRSICGKSAIADYYSNEIVVIYVDSIQQIK